MPQAAPLLPSLFNHCNVSPWLIASWEFQYDPLPVEIGDVLRTDRRLWQRLDEISAPLERGRFFHDYLSVKFRLHEWSEATGAARACLRHSYLHFLRNWGVDSNGPSGAALKSWVESRFGLRATYHRGLLATDADARARYSVDRVRGTARTASLFMQLDLLYTFCQTELARRHPGERWITLYRGTHDPDEYVVPAAQRRDNCQLIVLNNVSSFTSDAEVAWEFGSSVWEARVPLAKILFFSGMLPPEFLQGEAEQLVLGGEYYVRPLRY